MYFLAVLLLSFLPTPNTPHGPAPTDIVAAQNQHFVRIQADAKSLGTDNLRCSVTNLTSQELKVRIPPGLHFGAADAPIQDLLTYQQQLLTLAPGASGTVRLRGFCMEQHDRGPSGTNYTLRGFAGQGLQPLADSLNKYPQLAEGYGQYFVWAVTERTPVEVVTVSTDLLPAATNILRYLSTVTGKAPGKAIVSADRQPSVKTFTKNVYVSYHNPVAEVVSLKVYGADGRERHTLVKDKKVAAGVLQYSFGLNTILSRQETPAFTVRLLNAAGKVLHEVPVTETSPELEITPQKQDIDFAFSLDKPVQAARLRVRRPDGTLVEELRQFRFLPAGDHRLTWSFYHLLPAGTPFVVRLETADGKVLRQQPVGATAP